MNYKQNGNSGKYIFCSCVSLCVKVPNEIRTPRVTKG